MQTAQTVSAKPKKRTRMRYSNRFKVLLCYLVSFALPPLWQLSCLVLIYPYQLKNSAPLIAENLLKVFPFMKNLLSPYAEKAAEPSAAAFSAEAWSAAQASREKQWFIFLLTAFAAAWVLTLLLQLIWRWSHTRGLNGAKTVSRAIVHYRLSMLVIMFINAAAAAVIWLLGVQFIAGRGLWDYLTYFGAYALNILAALCCFRLAAPPAISGKKAFFKRL